MSGSGAPVKETANKLEIQKTTLYIEVKIKAGKSTRLTARLELTNRFRRSLNSFLGILSR